MRVVTFGSLNIDHVYRVQHFVRPGETLMSDQYQQFAGGKGCNQSIALARAGANVYHAGRIGTDGVWLKAFLDESGVDTSWIEIADCPSGHAIIQVNPEGENAIILHPGANFTITENDADKVLKNFGPGDWLLLQNEISANGEIMKQGAELGLKIVFNPAPMSSHVHEYPLHLVDYFILNEIEGKELTNKEDADKILKSMIEKYPKASTVLTLGDRGAWLGSPDQTVKVPADKVKPVDTTAAGDTFIGYLLHGIIAGRDIEAALKTACKAAAICVTRPGAVDSIPKRDELENM